MKNTRSVAYGIVGLIIASPMVGILFAAPIINANGRSVNIVHYYEQTTGTSDVEIVAAAAGSYYIIHYVKVSCSADSNVSFKTGSTTIDRTQLTGDGYVNLCWPVGCFETGTNAILNFNSSASATCDVTIAYEVAN